MKKKLPYEAGDKCRAVCEKCKKIGPAVLHYGEYKIPGSGIVIPSVLLIYCKKCGTVVGTPHQSSDTIHTGMLTAHRLLEDLKKWAVKWQKRAKKNSSSLPSEFYQDFLELELLPKLEKMSLPPFATIVPKKEK